VKNLLIKKINDSLWWHTPPLYSIEYQQRGKFLESTYRQAEFYGRPNNEPERVEIRNPIYGFSEFEILRILFGRSAKEYHKSVFTCDNELYATRLRLDTMMHGKAKELGYDAIVLMSRSGRQLLQSGIKPHAIELNLVL